MRPGWQELHGVVPYIIRVRQGIICANKAGVNVRQSVFTDVDYADDAVLFTENDAQWMSIVHP